MKLTEENCNEIIYSFNEIDWQKLFYLIPEIENTKDFGSLIMGEKVNGILTMPYYKEHTVVADFHRIVYEIPVVISFDWGSWTEGHKILNTENFEFDTIDVVTKCKLITTIVRNDRFCEGALVNAFKSGIILKILKSIRNQIKS